MKDKSCALLEKEQERASAEFPGCRDPCATLTLPSVCGSTHGILSTSPLAPDSFA